MQILSSWPEESVRTRTGSRDACSQRVRQTPAVLFAAEVAIARGISSQRQASRTKLRTNSPRLRSNATRNSEAAVIRIESRYGRDRMTWRAHGASEGARVQGSRALSQRDKARTIAEAKGSALASRFVHEF